MKVQGDQLTENSVILDPVAEGLKLMQSSKGSLKDKELNKYQ
jgi:hypothetical protein